MRLTDSINRGLKLYKHRRCFLDSWTLHPDEASVAEGGERNLQYQPLCIYLRFEDAEWQIGDLEPGVYPLEPISRDWVLNERTKMKAKRRGFLAVPDFSATAHMLQGATLFSRLKGFDIAHLTDRQRSAVESVVRSDVGGLMHSRHLEQVNRGAAALSQWLAAAVEKLAAAERSESDSGAGGGSSLFEAPPRSKCSICGRTVVRRPARHVAPP